MAENQKKPKKEPPRKRTANSGCLTGILYFMGVVGISALLAGLGWQWARDVLGFMKPNTETVVVVPENADLLDISELLHEKGLIEYPWLFRIYGRLSEADEKIDPGTYTLRTSLDYRALVNGMTEKSELRVVVRVTIPEGLTLEQVFALLAENNVCTLDKLRDTALNHEFEYDFIRDLPKTEKRLEGYLYPDTYDFYENENPVTALSKMLSNFNRKLSKEFKEQIVEMGSTLPEIVNIAAMIQNEAANIDEMGLISSVIYNRLAKPSDFPLLGIDATVQYLLPEHKEKLTQADLDIDSPYNTRKYPGLPPGPISNPGIDAIRAAIYPEETSYYWYALTDEGIHEFAKTEKEFNRIKSNNPLTYGG